MIVCIGWWKDGSWKFGRVMHISEALPLCRKMKRLTGVSHYTFPLTLKFNWTELADFSCTPRRDYAWIRYKRYEGCAVQAMNILKKRFRRVDYQDLRASTEFELYRLAQEYDNLSPHDMIMKVAAAVSPLFKRETPKGKYCNIFEATLADLATPEYVLIKEQEQYQLDKAKYRGKKQMTEIERRVFRKFEQGLTERDIADELGISQPRVNKLKQSACTKVKKEIN